MLKGQRAAIDIGSHSTKVLEYKPSKKGIIITNINRIGGINDEGLLEEIQKMKSKKITLMIHGANSTLLDLEDEEKPEKFLKERVKSLSKEGYNADYIELDENYLFSYIQRDTVDEIVGPISKKKDIVAIDTSPSAMYYLSKLYDEFESNIFFNIGHLSSEMLIIHHNEIIKYDKINIGISQLIEDIKERIGASQTRAMELVLRLGLNKNDLPINANDILDDLNITDFEYGSTVGDRMDYFLSRMADMLVTKHSFKADSSKMILLGGGSLIKGMEGVIKDNLEIEIEKFSLVSSTSGDIKVTNDTNKKIDSAYAQVVGLALREVIK